MKSRLKSYSTKEPETMKFLDEKCSGEMAWMLKLLELKNSGTFCDIIISKGSTLIYAHSCILAAFSPFMMDLLKNFARNDWSVSKPLKINPTCMTKCKKNSDMNCIGCIGKVVDFLYTGKILIEYSHVTHLINLSKNLELLNLLSVCQEFANKEKTTDMTIPLLHKVIQDSSLGNLNVSIVSNSKPKSDFLSLNEPLLQTNSLLNSAKSLYFNGKEKKSSDVSYINEEKTNNTEKLPNISRLEQIVENTDEPLKPQFKTCGADERTGEYYCIKCKLRFISFKMFEAHKKVFHKRQFICLSCNFTTFKLSYIVFHLTNMNHEENCCSVCLFKAKDSSSLKVHLQDHKNDFPFKCYDCGNMFKARTEWLRHMFIHNVQEKHTSSQVCEVCGFVAPYKSVLERHSLKHSKVNKSFTCPVIPCSFSTYSKYNLNQHMLTHESEKCVTCEICSLKFSQEKNLKRHIQTLHEPKCEPYKCCRCDYKSVRIDKIKGHCHSFHPADEEALNYILKQHKNKKFSNSNCNNEETKQNIESKKSKVDNLGANVEKEQEKTYNPENNEVTKATDPQIDLISGSGNSNQNTFILSETTGEFNIISENQGESIPVASVTSTNVLTIGNFREGTGSVTLNETTGILTFNNINSESTGAVFLNESTGELSYINLSKDSLTMDVEKTEPKQCREVRTQLNEFTGEIFTVDSEKKLPDINEEDALFDSFDMDIGNDDSCDGFDDLDGLLFDPIDIEGTDHIGLFISRNDAEPLKNIPHLNEATGELSFDCMESTNNNDIWNTNCNFDEEETEDPYRLLLNEVTGEFS